jgi:type IV pilus assembly protein PilN
MRLKLNLATQPYAEVRQFLFRWTLVLVLAVIGSAILLVFAGSVLRSWNTVRKQESQVEAKIAERDQLRVQAQNFLGQPQNRDTRDKSQFLNELIARKAFSWTQVFSDLEKIMPVGLHVVSVTPAINESNQIEVKMTVNGRSPDRAIELVKRLEDSKHFTLAQIIDQRNVTQSQMGGGAPGARPAGLQAGDLAQFQISAVYVPTALGAMADEGTDANKAASPSTGATGSKPATPNSTKLAGGATPSTGAAPKAAKPKPAAKPQAAGGKR